MTRERLSNIVEKLQIWGICASLGFILWFGRDVYYNVKDTHDMSIRMQQKQEDMQRTIDRHENMLSQLKNNQ